MKFIKEWSEWNPILNKEVLEFIEINKTNLRNLWDDSKSEEENMKFLIDYFTEYPDEMSSSINVDNIKIFISKAGLKNSAPKLMNIGPLVDFRSF
jgi:sulfatase maturation enzyme AslB (radical SAM superfamily)